MRLSRRSRRIWACNAVPIVINSKSCRAAGWWAKHLQKTETNESVEIIAFYGLSAETIEGAFAEMRVMAKSSKRCDNFFSQYNINPRGDEQLTEAQWEQAHALHRKNHGLDHLPYFRVRHTKNGRVHEHGIALRVDPETGKAIPDSLTAAINERTSRALEIRFDLARGKSVLTADRDSERERRPKKKDTFRGAESGIDPATVKADLLAAKRSADNAHAFKAALEASGNYVLARGDRRDFVIIDRAGDDHSLARRLGMKAAAVRAFMADLDPASLPSVDEARAVQKARAAAKQNQPDQHMAFAAATKPLQAPIPSTAPKPPETGLTASDGQQRPTTAAIGKHRPPESEDMDDDIIVKQREQRQTEEDRQAATYADLIAARDRADHVRQEWQRSHDYGERHKRQLQEAQWRSEAQGDIADVHVRAIIAAGESRDFVQAVRREGSMITQDHARLQRDIAKESDPDKKHLLELKRDIEHADYMALANERIAAMSNHNGEQYKDAQQQQEAWSKFATELRRERLEQKERMAETEKAETIAKTEQALAAATINAADRQRAEFRADIGGSQPDAQAAKTDRGSDVPAHVNEPAVRALAGMYAAVKEREARRGEQQESAASPATRATEPERPAEVIHVSPHVPAREADPSPASPARENTDARQSNSAENVEITDSKAAKKAALAQARAETEQSIAQGQERGYGHSR
jgi:hypothetical protein